MKLSKVILWSAAILLIVSSCKKEKKEKLPAPADPAKELSLKLQKLIAINQLPGLSAGIIKNGRLVWNGNFGKANLQSGQPINQESIFKMASVSKLVTALAVMKLIEEQKLELDADINNYLPFSVHHPRFINDKITLRQLMTHSSGIADTILYRRYVRDFVTMDADYPLSLRDFCQGMLTPQGQYYDLESFEPWKPGAGCSYSNVGTALIGCMVEQVTGMSFEAYTDKILFQPLNLKHTSWHLAGLDRSRLTMAYDLDNSPLGLYTTAGFPSGGLFSNVEDMGKVLDMVMQQGTFNKQQLFKPATIALMKKVQFPDSKDKNLSQTALLWEYDLSEDLYLLGHNGMIDGGTAMMWCDEKSKTGAILMFNKTADLRKMEQFISIRNEVIRAGMTMQ